MKILGWALWIGVGLLIGFMLASSCYSQDGTYPCGFQKVYDICQQYELREDGARGNGWAIIEDGKEYMLLALYKEGRFVAVGAIDNEKEVAVGLYYILSNRTFRVVNLITDERQEIDRERACLMVGEWLISYEKHIGSVGLKDEIRPK